MIHPPSNSILVQVRHTFIMAVKVVSSKALNLTFFSTLESS